MPVWENDMTLAIGDPAPAYAFTTVDGSTVASVRLAGRKVVLYFYPKDDTSGCTKEAQEFSALSDKFAAVGVNVYGISKDSVASHAKFRTKYDLKVDLGSDPDGVMLEAFGVWVEKSMYGRKYMGVERSTFLIDHGKIAGMWRKVKVPGHAAAVLNAAQALG
jgi:thioredoxin-dependent peroxiredoxin